MVAWNRLACVARKLKLLSASAILVSAGSVQAHADESPRQLQAAARSLGAEVAHLVEDMQIELRRLPNAEHLLNDAREAAEGAEHLAESVDQGVDLAHATKDFQEFDEAWHHVAAQLRTASVSRPLQRGIKRVAQMDAALHRLLGVPAPVDIQEVRRLAESLAQAAQHLLEDTQQALGRSARSEPIVQVAEDFAEAAEHFRGSIAQGVNVEHARRDFAAVDEAWQALSDRIYTLSPYRFGHLQEAASRVAPTVGQLTTMLGVAAEPQPSLPPTGFRFDPPRGRTFSSDLGEFPRGSRTFTQDLDDSVFLPPSCDPATGRCCVPRGLPPRTILPEEDDDFDGPFVEEFVIPPSGRSYLGEFRSLERPAPGRRFEATPPQGPARPVRPENGVQPKRLTPDDGSHDHSDGHTHSHSDGHTHSHVNGNSTNTVRPAPALAPTPARPASPPTAQAKKPAPRPAEPELDDEARANLGKLAAADRDAAIAQRVCPVTGDALGAMGVPLKVRVQGRDVFVCCKGCVNKLQKEPEKYLPKIDQ